MPPRSDRLRPAPETGLIRLTNPSPSAELDNAVEAYLAVRPRTTSEALLLGQRGEPLRPRAVELLVAKYARDAASIGAVGPIDIPRRGVFMGEAAARLNATDHAFCFVGAPFS